MAERITTPSASVIVRPAAEGDAAAYRELRLEALRDHPQAFGSDYETALARPPEWWVERLKKAGTPGWPRMYLAWAGGEPAGLCGLVMREGPKVQHNAELISMYVRPAWRVSGVADALIASALQWAKEQGATIVKLAVVTTNLGARRCYERNGFAPYGTEPEALCHGGAYLDEMLMARKL